VKRICDFRENQCCASRALFIGINENVSLSSTDFCPKRIKFFAINIYKTAFRLYEFCKTLYREIISLLGGRK
jgi:hypothetical protein